jgi:hypothetical protein
MECDQPTPPVWVVDSPSSHDSLDFEFPLEKAILEVMASTDNLNKVRIIENPSSIVWKPRELA